MFFFSLMEKQTDRRGIRFEARQIAGAETGNAEDSAMAGDRGTRGPRSRWPDVVQFVFVVCLTMLFLLLAVSMQRHHFLRGELYKQSHPYSQ